MKDFNLIDNGNKHLFFAPSIYDEEAISVIISYICDGNLVEIRPKSPFYMRSESF